MLLRSLLAVTAVAAVAVGVAVAQTTQTPSDKNVWDWDELKNGCGITKSCLGVPAGCDEDGVCIAIATVEVIDEHFVFRLRASDASWVAVGLGETNKMYDTSVIECVDFPVGSVNAYISQTPSRPNRGCTRISGALQQQSVTLLNSRSMQGGLYCEVQRVNATVYNGHVYDLNKTPLFLQVAHGTKVTATGIGIHAGKNAAGRATILAEPASTGSASRWPMRLHAAFMVIAWMFAATAGTLAARFFKAAWGKATICGKAMWFAWHRLLMVLTVVLHVAAVIAALVYLEGWSTSSGLHGIFGGVTTGLALLQGAGGLLRPSPDHQHRPVFNWVHQLQGFITHALAIITIFLSVSTSGMPAYVYAILGLYVAFYFGLHALHSLTEVKSYYFLVIVFGAAAFTITMLVLVLIGVTAEE